MSDNLPEFPFYEKDEESVATAEPLKVPLNKIPQGKSSRLDSDTVDGFQVTNSASPSANSLVALNQDGRYPESTMPAGSVVQVVRTDSGAVATGATAIPLDDTIPQNTEGDEYLTCSITPKSATNRLVVTATLMCATNVANAIVTAALFRDSAADAVAVSWQDATGTMNITFSYTVIAGSVSATTFKLRAGPNAGATITVNGSGGTRRFGGKSASSLMIQEFVV